MLKTLLGAVVVCALALNAPNLLAHPGGGRGPGVGPDGLRGRHHRGDRELPCYLAAFDTDGDGSLNDEEEAAAAARLAEFDANGSGRLSCEERSAAIAALCTGVEAPTCPERPQRPLPCFLEPFDADGDGALDEEERAAARARIEEVRAAADANGDGVVTRREMRAALETLCADEEEGDDEDDGDAEDGEEAGEEAVVQAALQALGSGVESPFVRGDVDASGDVGITDAVNTLGYLFQGGAAPACMDSADANDDGTVDISDPLTILGFLFLGSTPPPAPYPAADYDPTDDGVACVNVQGT